MAGRCPRGVPRAPNPPCRRSQDHGKNHPHTERGQSREKPSPGGPPEECALQEVKAEGSSAPRSWGAWAHSVRPSPPTRAHFPPRPGSPHNPSPPPRPPSQKTSRHTSLLSHKTPSAAPAAVSLCVITLNTPRSVSTATAAALLRPFNSATASSQADLPTSSSFLCFALNFLQLADILFGFSGFKCLYVLVRTQQALERSWMRFKPQSS